MRVDTGSCGENSGEVGVMEVASGQEKKYQKSVNRGLSLMCRRRAKWRKCFPTHTVVEITSASVFGSESDVERLFKQFGLLDLGG